jgi:DNA-directed RNA polymerase subunit beta'
MTNPTPKFTTAGSLLLKHGMPTPQAKANFDIYTKLDKPGMAKMVNMLLEHGGDRAHEHINDLGKLFFNTATSMGASTPLSDYINDSEDRQAIIKEFDTKVQLIKSKNLSKNDLNAELSTLTGEYNKKIEKQNLDYLLARNSMAAKMANTGARGNPAQLGTATSTPLMSANMSGRLVPIVIKHSFAEGMSPAEALALSYMGRGSTVLAQLSTALPGALFKRISPTVFHEVITVEDCGTRNGIVQGVEDKKAILGRFEARTNILIDDQYQRELVNSGKKQVKVRSSMTCEAHDGICKKCFGLMANGKMPKTGENVGVIAAQSISEVLTQAMLSTKHKATVGERKGNAYEQASNILNNPTENFKDEATIATVNGTVNKVELTHLGDTNVYVNGQKHFVPIAQNVTVKEGDKILQGDRLSTGVINPRKLVALRGLGAGRKYLADELRNIYGGGLDPRHFEIVAKNLIRYVQVVDPGESGFLPGDKIEISAVTKFLQHNQGIIDTELGEGKLLAAPVLNLTPGTLLDANHINELKEHGITKISVSPSGLRVTPIVPGLQTAKLLDKNWVSKMSFAKLKDTLAQAAALNESSPIHSTDPIAPYVMGTEFGEGSEGKY